MKKIRYIALLLLLIFCLGGCAPREEDDITANENNIVTGDSEQTSGQNEETEQNEPSSEDEKTESKEQTPTEKTPSSERKNDPKEQKKDEPSSGNTEQQTETPTTGADGEVDITKDVRYFGRVYEQDGTYYFNWTESGFCFSFTGTGAEATIESNAPGGKDTAYLRICVDNKPAKHVALTDSMQTVTLAKGLTKGKHTVYVYKRTNARSSTAGLMDLTLLKNGKIEPPPAAKTRKIELIGDSLTVGYGVAASPSTASWSTATEDGSQTYAALAAKAVNAEYNVVAISGRGLAHNTGGDTDKLMPALYTKTDEYNLPGAEWNFNSFVPDVIVMNLGANDNGKSSTAEIVTAATAFLKTIRQKNKNAYIIVAYGINSSSLKHPEIVDGLKKAVSNMNDKKISYFALPTETGTLIGHPDKPSHKKAAQALEQEIRRVTGWKD